MTDKLAQAACERDAVLRGARSEIESLWELIARYMIPRKMTFREKTGFNAYRDRQVLDSTAPRALEQFASFLFSSLNNPTHDWTYITPENMSEEQITQLPSDAKAYMRDLMDNIYRGLTCSPNNIYAGLHETYLDLGAFGTGVLFIEGDPARPGWAFRVLNFHLDDVVVDEAESGLPDLVVRRFRSNPRRLMQRWPADKCGKTVERASRATGDSKDWAAPIKCFHMCFPRTDETLVAAIPEALRPKGRDWAFYAAWINATDEHTISVEGYDSNPYIVSRWVRWSQGGTPYGRSQGMTVLGDTIMVNRMAETVLRGAEKLVDPPLYLPEGGILSPVRLHPGGLTYGEPGTEIKPLIPPGASRIELADAMIEQRQKSIQDGFFVPLFTTPQSPVMTATQTMQIADERNRMTAPMIVRLEHELFDRIMKRCVDIAGRRKLLAPVPESIPGRMQFRYRSGVAASVKQLEGLAISRWFESLAPWAQVDPGVFDGVRLDAIGGRLGRAAGVPNDLIRNRTEIAKVQRQREEQAKQQQMLGAINEAVGSAAKARTADAAMIKATGGA